MFPFETAFALDPLFAISLSIVPRVKVNLNAEVAVLIVIVGLGALSAEPHELSLLDLSPRPTLIVSDRIER